MRVKPIIKGINKNNQDILFLKHRNNVNPKAIAAVVWPDGNE